MVKPVMALLDSILPGRAETVRDDVFTMDKTFDEVFARIESRAREAERRGMPAPDRRRAENGRDTGQRRVDETGVRDEREARKAGGDKKQDKASDNGPVAAAVEKDKATGAESAESVDKDSRPAAATEKTPAEKEDAGEGPKPLEKVAQIVAEKLEQLKEEDPEAFEDLLAGAEEMTLGDFLKALGVGAENLENLGKLVDLETKLAAGVKEALASGGKEKLTAVFRSLGLSAHEAGKLAAALRKGQDEAGKPDIARQGLKTPAADENNSTHTLTRAVNTDAAGRQGQAAQETSRAFEAAVKAGNSAAPEKGGGAAKSAVKAPQGADTSGPEGNRTSARTQAPAGQEKTAETTRRSFERAVMDQVVEKIRINVRSNGRSNMTIKLDPPSLGRIDMRVVTHDNQARVVMTAESPDVRSMMERDIESLRAALNNSGLKVDQIIVASSGEGFNFRNENLGGRRGPNGGPGRGSPAADDGAGAAEEPVPAGGPGRVSYHDGVLDVLA
ncbi:MAG: flagellar hook-length control protein FliK [Candidatus Nitrospinota bacterium M3_3B_026]